jgi:hypothetical protein
VNKVLIGYDGTVLAHAQTSTWKIFIVQGSCTAPELKGIIPHSMNKMKNYGGTEENDNSDKEKHQLELQRKLNWHGNIREEPQSLEKNILVGWDAETAVGCP